MSDTQDLTWTEQPPSLDDPHEARKAHEILSRESGVKRGEQDAEDLRPVIAESVAPPPVGLSKDLNWFFPCLAYCMMEMDKSLFELYAKAMDKQFEVTTYQSPNTPIAFFDGVDISGNSMFYQVQGVPHDISGPFVDFIETFSFTNPRKGIDWVLTAHDIRIADPFTKEKTGVTVTLLLPSCVTSRRRTIVRKAPGLALGPLILGLTQET